MVVKSVIAAAVLAQTVGVGHGAGTGAWTPAPFDEARIRFESEPLGAEVRVDGRVICAATPCARMVRLGPHRVSMTGGGQTREGEVMVESASEVRWSIGPDYALLDIHTTRADAPIFVDDRYVGRSPRSLEPLEIGERFVMAGDACWLPAARRVTLVLDDTLTVTLDAHRREGAVDVIPVDGGGDVVAGQIYVDGVELGRAPGRFVVGTCARHLAILTDDGRGAVHDVRVIESLPRTASNKVMRRLLRARCREECAE